MIAQKSLLLIWPFEKVAEEERKATTLEGTVSIFCFPMAIICGSKLSTENSKPEPAL